MKISDSVVWVGVNDEAVKLFEGQFAVEKGMAYNSYVILDDKIAVLDTVDAACGEKWLKNIETVLGGRTPDYLVISHVEPDHSANIAAFIDKYPSAKLVGNNKTFIMVEEYFGELAADKLEVKEGDALSLGAHELTFIFAPMVHWPEVMMSYEKSEKILFSADAFGKFGTTDADEDWTCEARRYYFGIVGKFGAQVQSVLKKAAKLEIEKICPLHGPVLTENIGYYVEKYDLWSQYKVESEGVVIAYTSIYGHTARAAELLAERLEALGCPKVVVTNLITDDIHEAVEDSFRYGKLIVCTTTYNGTIFPRAKQFIDMLAERNYRNRKVGFIENGSWAPVAARLMQSEFEKCKDISFCTSGVKIRSSVKENNLAEIDALAKEILAD